MYEQILIVDDSLYMRKVLRHMLTGAGYLVIEASDARAGIELYELERPDMVLMNLTMPELDGIEATRELIDRDDGVRVVICSSLPARDVESEALSAGAKLYLNTPCEPEELIAAVHSALGSTGAVEHDGSEDKAMAPNGREDPPADQDAEQEPVEAEEPLVATQIADAGDGETDADDIPEYSPEIHRMLRTLDTDAMAAFSDILLGLKSLPPGDQLRVVRGMVKLWRLLAEKEDK